MSIFSSIKRSAQSAKKHNAKLAEQKRREQQEDATMTPYHHVPTHAASDLLSSAPRSWVEADRERIVEENRRRSAYAVPSSVGSSSSGGGGGDGGGGDGGRNRLSVPGTPRLGSSLSYVSLSHTPADAVSPVLPVLPRSHSYSGSLPSPYQPGRSHDAAHQVPPAGSSQPCTLRGRQAVRWPIYETPDPGFDFGLGAQSSDLPSRDAAGAAPSRVESPSVNGGPVASPEIGVAVSDMPTPASALQTEARARGRERLNHKDTRFWRGKA